MRNVPHVLSGDRSPEQYRYIACAPSHKERLCKRPRCLPRHFLGTLPVFFRPTRRRGPALAPSSLFPLDTFRPYLYPRYWLWAKRDGEASRAEEKKTTTWLLLQRCRPGGFLEQNTKKFKSPQRVFSEKHQNEMVDNMDPVLHRKHGTVKIGATFGLNKPIRRRRRRFSTPHRKNELYSCRCQMILCLAIR